MVSRLIFYLVSPLPTQVGNCVGWGNYKYFVLLLLWGLAATATVCAMWLPLFFKLWLPLQPVETTESQRLRQLPAATSGGGGDPHPFGYGGADEGAVLTANDPFSFQHAGTTRVRRVCVCV